MMSYKRLSMDCAYNVRDIGGYPVGNTGMTKWGTFIRSEGLDHVTEGDAAFLYKYGIRTVIDPRLHSEFERTNTKYLIDMLEAYKITHISIPLIDSYDDITMHFYIHMIETGRKNIKDNTNIA